MQRHLVCTYYGNGGSGGDGLRGCWPAPDGLNGLVMPCVVSWRNVQPRQTGVYGASKSETGGQAGQGHQPRPPRRPDALADPRAQIVPNRAAQTRTPTDRCVYDLRDGGACLAARACGAPDWGLCPGLFGASLGCDGASRCVAGLSMRWETEQPPIEEDASQLGPKCRLPEAAHFIYG
jgi:hypothetical protein